MDAAKKIHGKVPVIVIDGVDLVAKHDGHTLHRLLTHAKVLANNDLLKVALVSSEGNIVPVLNEHSYMTRSIILEIGDISDEQAMEYLLQRGVPVSISKEVVNYVGGRLVFLETCVKALAKEDKINQDSMKRIRKIFALQITKQAAVIEKLQPISGEVLKKLSAISWLGDFLKGPKATDVERTIQSLVAANVLRYDVRGNVMWHSRIQEQQFKL